MHSVHFLGLSPGCPVSRAGHCALYSLAGDVLADFVLQSDDRLHDDVSSLVHVLEAGVEVLLGLLFQDALVDLEYLVTWVLGLGFHGLGVGPNDVASLVRPLHPIAEVPLRLLRQELLQLLLVRLPIDLKLLFHVAAVLYDLLGLDAAERVPLNPVGLLVPRQFVLILTEVDLLQNAVVRETCLHLTPADVFANYLPPGEVLYFHNFAKMIAAYLQNVGTNSLLARPPFLDV